MKAVRSSVCASCGYRLAGLGQVGAQVRCPECGYEQTLRTAPGEVKATGFWFSSFALGGVLFLGCAGGIVSLHYLHLLRGFTGNVLFGIFFLAWLLSSTLGGIRFTKRLTSARREAGVAPESGVMRAVIVGTTTLLFGSLYLVIAWVGVGTIAMAWHAITH